MSDIINLDKTPIYFIDNPNDIPTIAKVCHSLSSESRIQLLRSVLQHPKSISTLSEELCQPVSNVSRYAEELEEAGLIKIAYQPGKKGHTKFCSAQILSCTFSMDTLKNEIDSENEYTVEMPIGMFTRCNIVAPCGMISDQEHIEMVDNVKVFFSPKRVQAECLWFDAGFIGYDFPLPPTPKQNFSELSFTFEICSEADGYNNNWASDITVCINGLEILTFTSPGDFGGTRGKFTPEFWPTYCTQFGLLKKITINTKGVFLDNSLLYDKLTLDDLHIHENNSVQLEIGVKENAEHRGGLNLFGKNFGDYNQSIIMHLK